MTLKPLGAIRDERLDLITGSVEPKRRLGQVLSFKKPTLVRSTKSLVDSGAPQVSGMTKHARQSRHLVTG